MNKTRIFYWGEVSFLIILVAWFLFSAWPLPFIQGSDGYTTYLPQSAFCVEELLWGHLPLWNEYQFCGHTLLNNGTLNFLNIGSVFYFFMNPAWAYSSEILLYFVILIFGSWCYFKKRGYSPAASLIGTIVYAYGGQTFFWSIYHGQNFPILLLPITLILFRKYEETASRKWQLAAFCAVFLMCCGGFLQLTFFALFAILLEGMQGLSSKSVLAAFRTRGKVLLLGLSAASFNLLPALETVLFSHRNLVPYKDVFSPGISSLVLLSFLGVFGGWAGIAGYFFFLGMGAVGLAFYALRKAWRNIISKPLFIFSILLAVFGILISLRIIPQNLFFGISTEPWRGMFIFNFWLALTAAGGFQYLLQEVKSGSRLRYPPLGFIFIWIIALVLELASISYFINRNITINYRPEAIVLFSTGIILILGFLLFIFFRKSSAQRKGRVYSFLIIGFILANVLVPSRLYLQRGTVPFTMKDEPWRLFDIPVTELSGEGRFIETGLEYYQLESWGIYNKIRALGGYGSFFPRTIFKRMLKDGLLPETFDALTMFKNNSNLSAEQLSYYGVEYFILYAEKRFSFPHEGWQIYRQLENGIRIYKNLKFVGRSYITDAKGKIVRGAEIVSDTGNSVLIRTEAKSGEVLILADSWFPGWKCYDNARPVAGYDADGFRGYRIPETGLHEVKWVYDSVSTKVGIFITLLTFVLIFIRMLKAKK